MSKPPENRTVIHIYFKKIKLLCHVDISLTIFFFFVLYKLCNAK